MKPYLIANYHSHTTRCKHARGTMEEYVQAAIDSGIQIFGFSDHVPCPFKNAYESGIRMRMQEAESYISDVRELQQKYAGKIKLLAGFETEYLPQFFDEQTALFDKLGVDYMIMGQHFLEDEQKGPYTGSPTKSDAFLKAYVDHVIEGMGTGRFAYLAHPDLIHYIGDSKIYEREIRRMCKALKEMHIPLEINLLGLLEHKHYPREDFWAIAGSVGNDVILGIDAHWPEQIGDIDTYRKALELVKKYNLNLIQTLDI